jgi:primosomal protein N' (replication factor Y)
VDEEHDASFKQQDGFRYSARDLAVVRAHWAGIPVVLGSATPSLESLYNVSLGRYRRLRLAERAGPARPPRIRLLDIRGQRLVDGLSSELCSTIRAHLDAGGQALVFINRRGFAPTLICHACGAVEECRHCDARLTLHRRKRRLICHHCGAERPAPEYCAACGSTALTALGHGTERIERALNAEFSDVATVRIDRDSTRRKGELERRLSEIARGAGRLLVGTQMIAKGHDFPAITLVAIVNADYGLYGADFRAAERLAQIIVQVAGRAGRRAEPGEVVIQTHHPEHPLLTRLISEGYHAFAEAALAERRAVGLPPFSAQALLRAEASNPESPRAFLEIERAALPSGAADGVEVFGPAPAPMERRAGRYRAQLLLQAARRADLQRTLKSWTPALEAVPAARRVRWSLDVDPLELL